MSKAGNQEIKKNIIVNYIAASTGGAYTVLVQFIESVLANKQAINFNWIVFVSLKELEKFNRDNVQIVYIKSKNWIKRIFWDVFGIQSWLKKNNVKVHKICSLQNTGIPNIKAEQYVYLHQSLILAKQIKLKWFEYKLELYKFIYTYSVRYSIRPNMVTIVQTQWMKNALAKQFKVNPEKIIVLKPKIGIKYDSGKNTIPEKYSFKLFYPAVPHGSYKNHELLIRTLLEIKHKNLELYSKINILFTSDPSFNRVTEYCYNLSKRLNVSDKIIWCGYLDTDKMNETYSICDIVLFPSQLESFPLPLIEASSRGKRIFTLNNSFSHEVLNSYKGVDYIENSQVEWANKIDEFYNQDFPDNIVYDRNELGLKNDMDIVDLLIQ